MFCPYCKRQIKDTEIFCPYCGKAIPKQDPPKNEFTPMVDQEEVPAPLPVSSKKSRISTNAIKGIVTVALIAVLVVAVLVIFYPHLLPWS